LVLGGIDYGPGAEGVFGQVWKRLPGSAAEAEKIAELFQKQPRPRLLPLSGTEASHDRLVAASREKWRYPHLCRPGHLAPARQGAALVVDGGDAPAQNDLGLSPVERQAFMRNQLLLSGLVLAGANETRDHEKALLTAEDVGALDLSGTELVVLSACDTGLGN